MKLFWKFSSWTRIVHLTDMKLEHNKAKHHVWFGQRNSKWLARSEIKLKITNFDSQYKTKINIVFGRCDHLVQTFDSSLSFEIFDQLYRDVLSIFLSNSEKNSVFMCDFPDSTTTLSVHLFILCYSRVQKMFQCLLNYAIRPIRTRMCLLRSTYSALAHFSPLSSMYHTIVRCHSQNVLLFFAILAFVWISLYISSMRLVFIFWFA